MFRAEQLDWAMPELAEAGAAAFALLIQAEAEITPRAPLQTLSAAMTQWSLVHGLSTLVIDGRLGGVAQKMQPDADIEALIDAVLTSRLCPAAPES